LINNLIDYAQIFNRAWFYLVYYKMGDRVKCKNFQ